MFNFSLLKKTTLLFVMVLLGYSTAIYAAGAGLEDEDGAPAVQQNNNKGFSHDEINKSASTHVGIPVIESSDDVQHINDLVKDQQGLDNLMKEYKGAFRANVMPHEFLKLKKADIPVKDWLDAKKQQGSLGFNDFMAKRATGQSQAGIVKSYQEYGVPRRMTWQELMSESEKNRYK